MKNSIFFLPKLVLVNILSQQTKKQTRTEIEKRVNTFSPLINIYARYNPVLYRSTKSSL